MPFNTSKDLHILQTDSWGAFKALYGWEPVRVQGQLTSVLILFKRLPLGLSIAYVPKASVNEEWQALLPKIEAECRNRHAVFLQIEPDVNEPYDVAALERLFPNYITDENTIQPRGTILIDISQDEEAILAAMKQKTRYNIRLAERKGVKIEQSDDLEDFYEQTLVTSQRDGFAVHSFDYYKNVYDLFEPQGRCVLLRASYEGQSLAYLMLFLQGERAWYLYGASNDELRNLMPTYLLQWEAMRYAKAKGATVYDMWGIPDVDENQLEEQFMNRSDGLWGVYRFKRGFGGEVKLAAPAYVKAFKPLLYKAYLWIKKKRGGGEHASL